MASETSLPPSFSRARRWGIMFNVVAVTVAVLAVVVMVNYISARHPRRFYISTHTRIELTPTSLAFLHTITNVVDITLYYDRDSAFYGDFVDLLREYHDANPNIKIHQVDPIREPTAAQVFKAQYAKYGLISASNVLFDCEGRVQVVPGNTLINTVLEQLETDSESGKPVYYRKPVSSNAELAFSAAILAVTSPKPVKACFLQGDGEPDPADIKDPNGYGRFTSILQRNYIEVDRLFLTGTNGVPDDCNLLIFVAPPIPAGAMPDWELKQIEDYLTRNPKNGRLLALFNFPSSQRPTGLESVLAKWRVNVVPDIVIDPDSLDPARKDFRVAVAQDQPAVNSILGIGLNMTLPRPVSPIPAPKGEADGPKVDSIAATGPNAFLNSNPNHRDSYPVMVALDQGTVKGLSTDRGVTRMIVSGDSYFLSNGGIELGGNQDFVTSAVNWLLDRQLLFKGLGPRPITPYRIMMTRSEMQTAELIMLAAVPGGVLLLGCLVWLRRRK